MQSQKRTGIPPIFSIAVLLHETHVHVIFLMARHLELTPDFLSVIETDVDKNSRHSSKGHAVGKRKLGREEERRILLVCRLIELEVLAEDAGDVVNLAHVVVRLHRLDWYVVRVPCTAEVDTTGNDNKEADNTDKHVENGVEGWNQRRANEAAKDGPVKGDGHEAIAMHPAKELVDDGAVGPNPAEKAKVREAFENPTREPVPYKCGETDDTEELVAA